MGEFVSPSTPKEARKSRRRRFWEWLGFGEEGEKTGLDLLQTCAVLSIPLVVAFVGVAFALIMERRAQDTVLQTYVDQMSSLLLSGELLNSKQVSEANTLARARTLTVLAELDGTHKGRVVKFLYEARLIGGVFGSSQEKPPVVSLDEADLGKVSLESVSLYGADLSGADLRDAHLNNVWLYRVRLRGANLRGAYLLGNSSLNHADLSGADLRGAYLSDADLRGADLSGGDLRSATVTEEQLASAKSLEGATMPDGSKHD